MRLGAALLTIAASLSATGAEPVRRGPATSHFQAWLNSSGYADDAFPRLDYGDVGSFGGREFDAQQVTRTPVIFVHGNSDAALRTSDTFAGWEFSYDYFIQQGYTTAELYATSYQDHDISHVHMRTHSCATVSRLRRFVEAVRAYTNASTVHIVAHSLGVTLARKVVKGGPIVGDDGTCNIGAPLRFVDVFVGIAGGNFGLCSCQGLGNVTLDCNFKNGFWPGDSCGLNLGTCPNAIQTYPCNGVRYSNYLTDLNNDLASEGKRIVSVWSTGDELINNGDLVWGRATSSIPRGTDEKAFKAYSHMETKEKTAREQYEWVNRLA